MSVTNVEDEYLLAEAIAKLVKKGWAVETQTSTTASLSRKKFSLLWFLVTFGTYLLWFLLEKKQTLFLRVKNGKVKRTKSKR